MNSLSIDTVLAVPEDVIFRELDGEAIILNLATGMYFGLDEIGTRVWSGVSEAGTVRVAVDRLDGEYDVRREQLEADALDLASQLIDKGLLQVKA